MDPVTAAILAAIAAGAAAGLTDLGKQAIGDAYNGLKAAIKKKFGEESEVAKALTGVEAKPDSTARKEMLKEEVAAAKADQDPEVLAVAQALLNKLNALPGGGQVIQSVAGNRNVLVTNSSGVTVNINTPTDEKKTKPSG